MLFPEFHRRERNSMKPSSAFIKGIHRRLFNRPKQKVFVIGFHKTGTSSLGKALQMLGYSVCGSLKEGYDYHGQVLTLQNYLISKAKPLFTIFDAFQDTPWFLLYQELYEQFPDGKFILTTRDENSWLRSVQNHFGKNTFPYHDQIYGTPDSLEDEGVYLERYRKHNEDVRQFFSDKPGQLLIMNLKESDRPWIELCEFLGVRPPCFSFPHANKGDSRGNPIRKLKKLLKKIYYRS